MSFKNEKISEPDRVWISKLVNYESIRAISRWVHNFRLPCVWTTSRERNAFLISLGGGGSPDDEGRLPYAVLILDGEVVVFNLSESFRGSEAAGVDYTFVVQNLMTPAELAGHSDDIRALIREALNEQAFLRPFADGGTVANPNLVARGNVRSCTVAFK